MIITFAEKHAKKRCPSINDVLERFEIERRILDIFEDIRDREYMIFEDYQKLINLKVPFLDMLCKYKNVEPFVALDLIKLEYVTYGNLIQILKHFDK